MGRFRFGGALLALVISAAALQATVGASAAAAQTPCTFTTNSAAKTVTLDSDCDTTTPLPLIPDGFTLNGGGHTVTVADPPGGHFSGAVVHNEGATMNVENLIIEGPSGGLAVPTDCSALLFGILFGPSAGGPPPSGGVDASGTVTNVQIHNLYQKASPAFGNCQVGHAIRANAFTSAQTVTITNTTVTGYQKGGLTGSGPFMTMNVSNSTVGPPAPLEGSIAQNGVQYGGGGANAGSSGKISDSTIYGSGDQTGDPSTGGGDIGTAVLLFASKNVTVTNNTITGAKTDRGIDVEGGSTGSIISLNKVGRTEPDVPDGQGIGIFVERPGNEATLICNTFNNWKTNIVGAIQLACTPLPNGAECHAYTAHAPTIEGGPTAPPLTWSVASGSLPPGLQLAADGAITGIPTKAGTYKFSLKVTDVSDPPLTAAAPESITIEPDCATSSSAPPSTPPLSSSASPSSASASPSSSASPSPSPSTSATASVSSSSPFVPGVGETGDTPPAGGLPLWAMLAGVGVLLGIGLLVARLRRTGKHG
jgi:hypothetical protein